MDTTIDIIMIAETIRTHGYELLRKNDTNEYWVYNPYDFTMISLNTYLYNIHMYTTYPNYYNYQNYQCMYGIYCKNMYCNYFHPLFVPYNASNYSYYYS